jgi:YceI-like domain
VIAFIEYLLLGNYDRGASADRGAANQTYESFAAPRPPVIERSLGYAAAMRTLDASAVECRVLTYKEGALSALAHDLELDVTRLTLELAEPNEAGEQRLTARFAADSLVVLHAMKDGHPTAQLSAADRRKIEKTLFSDVLDVRRHPEIRYEATATPGGAAGDGATSFRLAGELTLQGRRRPLALQARLQQGRLRAEATLHQPDFGVQPFSALLGALKIRPDITVRISLPWPLAPA